MQTILIQKQLKELNKSYYTLADLGRVLGQSGNVLKVTVHRLIKQDILISIERGLYFLPDNFYKLEAIISQAYFPCYLSFETALARYGILNQIPYVSIFAWTKKPKTIMVGEFAIELKQINRDLFWGYALTKDLYIAYPEKALLDQLYFTSLGKAKLDWDELNLHELSKTKFLGWAKKFPPPTQTLAKKLAKQFGKISITIK